MKKPLKTVMFIMAIGLLFFIAIQGKNYYQRRYVGEDYYGKVASDQSVEPILLQGSDGGSEIGYGMEYAMLVYNAQGEERMAKFDRYSKYSENLLQPNSYVKLSLSKEIVLKHEVVTQSDVPEGALVKLDQP